MLPGGQKYSDKYLVKYSLLGKTTYRLPDASKRDRLIGLKVYYRTFRAILQQKISSRLLSHENGDSAILHGRRLFFELDRNYVLRQSNYKVKVQVDKQALAGHFTTAEIPLKLLWLSLFSVPLVIAAFFSRRRVGYALLIAEATENANLLQILKKHNVKTFFDFSASEKDSNFLYVLLRKKGIRVYKRPSPGPLYLHHYVLIADTLMLSNQYQFEEFKTLSEHGVRVKNVEKWLPEFAFNFIDLYTEQSKTASGAEKVASIGYYSHGSWIRKKEGHASNGLRIYDDEVNILLYLNKYLKNRAGVSLRIFTHPREKKPELLDEAGEFYKTHLPDIQFTFSQAEKTSQAFHEVEVAVCAYSAVIYERLFCGFKTIVGLPSSNGSFPLNGSKLSGLCFRSFEEMEKKIDDALRQSAPEFFTANQLKGYAYTDYPYFEKKEQPQGIQQCTNCVLDTHDDPQMTFDDKGVCNYCRNYIEEYVVNAVPKEEKEKQLSRLISKIKEDGKGKKYDCLMGLSGGVDSTYLAVLAKEYGLRPLLVHFDNGWNSELAVKNIEGVLRKTGFDLFTYVVDWTEFSDLQMSYVKAGVLDWEIPSDHGFFACLYGQAYKHKITNILTGHNYQTEAILPKTMRWSKMDVANIKDIHGKHGTAPLKTFPTMGFWKFSLYKLLLGFERHNILDLLDYDREKAKTVIKKEVDWKDYGGKHHESIFTRFYQGYVLKEKFGFDKRKAHMSNLILSGQMTKAEALLELQKPTYDPRLMEDDLNYVAKKFNLSAEEFKEILAQPNYSHLDYKSYETGLYLRHEGIMKAIQPLTLFVKKVMNR